MKDERFVKDVIGMLSLTGGDISSIKAVNEYNIKKEVSSISRNSKKLQILTHIFCKTIQCTYYESLKRAIDRRTSLLNVATISAYQNKILSFKAGLSELAFYVSSNYNINHDELMNENSDDIEKKYKLSTIEGDPGLLRFLSTKKALKDSAESATNMEFNTSENIDIIDSSIGKDVADTYEQDIQKIINLISKSKAIIEKSNYNLEVLSVCSAIFVNYCMRSSETLEEFLNARLDIVTKEINKLVQ